MSLLKIRNLRLQFPAESGAIEVLRGVDLSMEPGQVLGLVGESGSGKSLTGLTIMGLEDERALVTADVLDVVDCNLLQASSDKKRQLRGTQISMVFQNPTTCLDPHYRVSSQIEEVLCVRGGLSKSAARRRALELLIEVGLSQVERVAKSFPHELSGGMNQRVMIALAIALQPQLIIADEPTTALDVTTQRLIIDLFKELTSGRQMALLFISHDLGVIKNLCDSVAVLYAGRVVESGSVAEVTQSPKHPYTRALLDSRPKLSGEKSLPPGIPGTPPQPGEIKNACSFSPRCTHALEVCHETAPTFQAKGTHGVACLLNDGRGL